MYIVDLDEENVLHLYEDGEEIESRPHDPVIDSYFVPSENP